MKHSVQHDLSPELAKKVLDKALESYKERFADYDPKMTWVGDKHVDVKFKAKGIAISGGIDLEPKAITFDLDVPFLLRPFKAQALDIIETQIRKWTDRAKNGEIS
jgi:hypothetical protein